MKIAALVPARSGSIRVKDKNLRLLGKYPLLVVKDKAITIKYGRRNIFRFR